MEHPKKPFREDPRYAFCKKEALYGLGLGLFNLLWWFAFGYGLGSRPVEKYRYILGLPDWFFISCILGAIVTIAATFYLVNHKMVDMSLDPMSDEEADAFEKRHRK